MNTLHSAASASASALTAERIRLEVAASNLANAESTRGPNGEPYRRRDVLLTATPQNPFDAALGEAGAVGVQVTGVVADPSEFKRRYDPSHPDADKDGFVAMPNVDVSAEMVDMMSASRAYQANLAAITIVQDLFKRALELGK